jgi:spore coat protein A
VDQTLHWANPRGNTSLQACLGVDCTLPANADNPCCKPYLGPVPVTVHLHGAETPSAYDGHPDTWWTPGLQQTGPSFVDNNYTYTNTMQPTTLWYHDHALGMTRINIYSGLAGFYFIRGTGDTGDPHKGLRLPAGEQELEMLIADRMFDTNGQLIFPDGSPVHNDEFPFGLNGPPPNPSIHPFWNPEFFGDVIAVNGKAWPKMTVKPMRYRFRILNASNARFYNLKLAATRSGQPPENGQPGHGGNPEPVFWVIGTDGGLLDKPVKTSELLIAPSERYDVIIDFSKLSGHNIEVTNDANGPFPGGDPVDPDTNGKVMRFEVGHDHVADISFDPAARNARLRGPDNNMLPPIVRFVDGQGGLANGVELTKKRQLVLVEVEGPDGPNEVLLNNTKWSGRIHGTDGPVPGSEPVGVVNITELPVVGSTELWEIVNLTDDAHPIHIHLGQFQLMNRQAIDADGYFTAYDSAFGAGGFDPAAGPPNLYTDLNDDGALGGNPAIGPYLKGPVLPPKAQEFGWKDVWTMLPGTVTRIVVRIAPQEPAVNAVAPGQNLFAFDPTAPLGSTDTFGYPGGPGYIWHCHILDHEDNEMMRPYIPVGLSENP